VSVAVVLSFVELPMPTTFRSSIASSSSSALSVASFTLHECRKMRFPLTSLAPIAFTWLNGNGSVAVYTWLTDVWNVIVVVVVAGVVALPANV